MYGVKIRWIKFSDWINATTAEELWDAAIPEIAEDAATDTNGISFGIPLLKLIRNVILRLEITVDFLLRRYRWHKRKVSMYQDLIHLV